MHKRTIVKLNCPQCRRFLFKFLINSEFRIVLYCNNCKNVSAFKYGGEGTEVKYAVKNRDFKFEPEGNISDEDFDALFER